jgi:endoglycosylceramidase
MFGSVICLHLSAVFSVCGAFIQVDPANQQLVDVEGRQRYFHGVNVVVKEPPWIPVDSSYTFTDKDMATLQELGLNALRLGMMWPGVEPERGKYNFTYLEVARNLTKQAASYGIFTLLDMHQDGYNAKLCGEGLPDWSVRTGSELTMTLISFFTLNLFGGLYMTIIIDINVLHANLH